MTGFIYVEPFEVRKEIIVRPADIQRMHDLGLAGKDTIPADQQEAVKTGIVEFLGEHFAVMIDGDSCGCTFAASKRSSPKNVNATMRHV